MRVEAEFLLYMENPGSCTTRSFAWTTPLFSYRTQDIACTTTRDACCTQFPPSGRNFCAFTKVTVSITTGPVACALFSSASTVFLPCMILHTARTFASADCPVASRVVAKGATCSAHHVAIVTKHPSAPLREIHSWSVPAYPHRHARPIAAAFHIPPREVPRKSPMQIQATLAVTCTMYLPNDSHQPAVLRSEFHNRQPDELVGRVVRTDGRLDLPVAERDRQGDHSKDATSPRRQRDGSTAR